jgi:hypothetical protein
MSTSRRVLSIIGLTVAVLIGSSVSASATFAESVSVSTTVGTATIAPPTQVEAKAVCTTTVDPVTLVSTTTTTVKIEWWRSTSPRVTGYRVTAYPAGAPAYVLKTTGPTDEIYLDDDPDLYSANLKISVTTLTGTTFTAESAKVPVAKC